MREALRAQSLMDYLSLKTHFPQVKIAENEVR